MGVDGRMLYQKLLMGKDAYYISVGFASEFEVHRHPELELSYCISGSYYVVIDGKDYLMKPGELAFVKPMAAHDIKSADGGMMMTVEMGPEFLGDYFDDFAKLDFDTVVNKDRDDEINQKLTELFDELVHHHMNRSKFSELVMKGNLFHISRLLLQHFSKGERTDVKSKELQDVAKVEEAIQIIYEEYPSKIDVEYVSTRCGYSISHFCRTFKKITGETFYNLLNRHRVEIACLHLRESKSAIEDIAVQVGFADAKSFCRVFGQVMGISPGKYRKESENEK